MLGNGCFAIFYFQIYQISCGQFQGTNISKLLYLQLLWVIRDINKFTRFLFHLWLLDINNIFVDIIMKCLYALFSFEESSLNIWWNLCFEIKFCLSISTSEFRDYPVGRLPRIAAIENTQHCNSLSDNEFWLSRQQWYTTDYRKEENRNSTGKSIAWDVGFCSHSVWFVGQRWQRHHRWYCIIFVGADKD